MVVISFKAPTLSVGVITPAMPMRGWNMLGLGSGTVRRCGLVGGSVSLGVGLETLVRAARETDFSYLLPNKM